MDITQERDGRPADRVGARDALAALAPDAVDRLVPEDDEGAKREQKLDRIDWERSRAVSSGQGSSYVLDDSERTRTEVVEKLSARSASNV